ncbi:MAG: hypothetical protein KKF33_09560 [Alphaproteobacteria bacterium]|nr:hypothetical protein [Alphaproteobacteria bacterium]
MLPASGAVLGVDVGGSLLRRSTAACRLSWTADRVSWCIERCTADPALRAASFARVIDGTPLLAAAFDGPLAPGLAEIDVYRAAERMLTRGLGKVIGKPGQSHVPVGRLLNAQANACVRTVLSCGAISAARHAEAIDSSAIVEAFPSSYLGLLLADPAAVPVTRANRSDRYFETLAENGQIAAILHSLLPGRHTAATPADLTNHDDRAALICALTALGVAAGSYCAVGSGTGWIILPPAQFIAPVGASIARGKSSAGL